ncbi:hypothetical protein FB451DRAFT_1107173 [Mycena latifolia]|nr:hypothetical protein FB451DRAFT_1107173 [Mycena latifolia]
MMPRTRSESTSSTGTTQPLTAGGLRASLASYRARIAEIEAQMIELRRSFALLRQEKDLLQGRLDAYTYPVLTLPNEIVAEIFVHFLPAYPSHPPLVGLLSPACLGQICRRWREVAVATPALWRAVGLCMHKRRRLGQQLKLLETFLQRSGACPLSIELLSRSESIIFDAITEMPPFLRAIVTHSARWEHLNLRISKDLLPSIAGPLPLLRSLKIIAVGNEPQELPKPLTLAFHTAPLLCRVHLRFYEDSNFPIFPWSQLTVLTVEWISGRQFVDILSWAVNLVFCRFGIYCLHAGQQPSLKDVLLPYLETLILCDIHSPGPPCGCLDMITLPGLLRLQVAEKFLLPDPITTLVTLVSRSGCGLEQVCITRSVLPERQYQEALPSVPSFIFDGGLDLVGMVFDDWSKEDTNSGGETESEESDNEESNTGDDTYYEGEEERGSNDESD